MGHPRQARRLNVLKKRFARDRIRPRTRLGQNFLLDKNQVNYIARVGAVAPGDVVLEVGPGTGFLTAVLAEAGASVLAVEVDPRLAAIAREATAHAPAVAIVEADVLAAKNRIHPDVLGRLAEMLREAGPDARLKCVSNLPYSAGTPFAANLFATDLPWTRAVFLLQLEVARRLAASPGSRDYGALSVRAALGGRVRIEREVPPQVFWPRPRVSSAVVAIDFLPAAERARIPWDALRRVMVALMGGRRKTLRNALGRLIPREEAGPVLEAAGIDPERRSGELAPEEFLAVTRTLLAQDHPALRGGKARER